MYSTLPGRKGPDNNPPKRPPRRGKRSKQRQKGALWLSLLSGAVGACLGAALVLGLLFFTSRFSPLPGLGAPGNSDKGFSLPYSGDAEVNQEANPSYSLPAYQGDSSALTIDFTPHSGPELSPSQLYAQVHPSTVSITVYAGNSAAYGSGMILTEDGYLLTCQHVIENCESCTVLLSDGREFEAKLVVSDAQTDLAVLKIEADGLPAVTFADSNKAVIGETVYAIGDPVRPEFRGTFTNGILSGTNRSVNSRKGAMSLLQITAPINSGNSGGPLFNAWGQVLGVVNMKLSRPDLGVTIENMGLAIPSRTAKEVVEELVQTGTVQRSVLGITCYPISEAAAHVSGVPQGLWITTIHEKSDCAAQGLKVRDIITAADGKPVDSVVQFKELTKGLAPGDSVTLTVWRDEQLQERLQKAEAGESSQESSAETDEEYHFEKLGDIQVKLVDADSLTDYSSGK